MPTNFWLEWAEVGGEIEASLTPSEAKSFTRMLRTRARGRPGSSWSEKASGASFECLLEESAGSPSASRAQRQRPPPKQDKNAAWAEKRAPWDANIDSTPYEFASAFELFAATNTKGRTWCVLFYEPENAQSRSVLDVLMRVAEKCAQPTATPALRSVRFGLMTADVLQADEEMSGSMYFARSISDFPVIKYYRRSRAKVALRGHGEAFTGNMLDARYLLRWLTDMNAMSILSDTGPTEDISRKSRTENSDAKGFWSKATGIEIGGAEPANLPTLKKTVRTRDVEVGIAAWRPAGSRESGKPRRRTQALVSARG